MDTFGERFVYGTINLTEYQLRLVQCRAETALRERKLARKFAASKKQFKKWVLEDPLPLDTNVAPTDTNVAPADTNVAPADTNVAPADTNVAPADTNVAPANTSTTDGVDGVQQPIYEPPWHPGVPPHPHSGGPGSLGKLVSYWAVSVVNWDPVHPISGAGVGWCNVGVGWCNVAVRWCNVAVRWCNVGVRWFNVAVRWCNVGVRWFNVGVRWCNVGVRWCNVGVQWEWVLQDSLLELLLGGSKYETSFPRLPVPPLWGCGGTPGCQGSLWIGCWAPMRSSWITFEPGTMWRCSWIQKVEWCTSGAAETMFWKLMPPWRPWSRNGGHGRPLNDSITLPNVRYSPKRSLLSLTFVTLPNVRYSPKRSLLSNVRYSPKCSLLSQTFVTLPNVRYSPKRSLLSQTFVILFLSLLLLLLPLLFSSSLLLPLLLLSSLLSLLLL